MRANGMGCKKAMFQSVSVVRIKWDHRLSTVILMIGKIQIKLTHASVKLTRASVIGFIVVLRPKHNADAGAESHW